MERKGRIYILPTGFGLLFIGGALLMILVGATYQNNLVNLLAFFMLSLIFIAMVQTHNNLKDVTVETLEAENGYKDGQYVVTAVLTNTARDPRFNLEFSLRRKTAASIYENLQPLLPKGLVKLKASYPAVTRGKFSLNEVKVHTMYPLGLFRAWTWLPNQTTYYVYPKPEGQLAFPRGAIGSEAAEVQVAAKGGDDFAGHRRYETGDSLSHIDWKAKARGRPLLIKEFNEGAPAPITLDWYQLNEEFDTEQKLSQLAQWVDEAVRRKAVFGLRLPGRTIQPSQGLQHAKMCLEALAVHERGNNVAS